jgi:hypothetical protein
MTIDSTKSTSQKAQLTFSGCGSMLLFLVMMFWVLVMVAISMFGQWSIEQTVFEGSMKELGFRWGVLLAAALGMLLPLALLARFTNLPRMKLIFTTWLIASAVNLLMIPARLLSITNSQATMALQIGGNIVFLIILWAFQKPGEKKQLVEKKQSGLGIGLLATLAVSIPWVLWGSLGDLSDTFLALVNGLLFGFTAMKILDRFISVILFWLWSMDCCLVSLR